MIESSVTVIEGQEGLLPQLEKAAEQESRSRLKALGAAARVNLGTTYAMTHVGVFDPHTRTRHVDQTVVVEGGRIRAVGPFVNTPIPEGARIVPGDGQTLLPGLWDAHYHISAPADGLFALAGGVICAYSPGDDPRKGPALRKAWEQGNESGPWVLSAMLLDGPGEFSAQVAVVVDSPDEVLKALDRARTGSMGGVDLPLAFKPMGSGETMVATGASGTQVTGSQVVVERLETGTASWTNLPITFQAGGTSGLIGLDIWLAAPVCFDFITNHLTFSLDAKGSLPFRDEPSRKLPLMWDRSGDTPALVVIMVKPGSVMEKAGCKAGDVLLQVGDLVGSRLTRRGIQDLVASGATHTWVVRRSGHEFRLEFQGLLNTRPSGEN